MKCVYRNGELLITELIAHYVKILDKFIRRMNLSVNLETDIHWYVIANYI